ncbi:MAG: hypothetical protein E3J30_02270 [Anaerolineales bacterium]|nr:MAG: hypothetical protein E3J30_02270 [Anaerolineales bacterium]
MKGLTYPAAFCVFLLLTGCNISTSQQSSHTEFPNFENIIDVAEIPRNLRIEPSESGLFIDKGSAFDLLITNDSDYTIEFPPAYGARLFAFDGDKKTWIEIQNLVEYVGDVDILGSKSNGSDNWAAYLTIAPDLPEFHTFEILRIAVVGTISNSLDPESHQVGAFINIPIDTR